MRGRYRAGAVSDVGHWYKAQGRLSYSACGDAMTPHAGAPPNDRSTFRKTTMNTDVTAERYVPTTQPASLGSGVSWGAIFAGVVGAASLSLILLMLGVGLGFSSVSPWSGMGLTAGTLGVSAIAWLTFTQLAASGMGGYLAGRLRTRWVSVQRDEVYFRDTAHGFLAWSLATLLTAAMLTSTVGAILGAGAQVGATAAGAVATTAAVGAGAAATGAANASPGQAQGVMSYFVDSLFRADASSAGAAAPAGAASAPAAGAPATAAPAMTAGAMSPPPPTATGPAPVAEVARILLSAQQANAAALPPEDARYVGQLIAARTGVSQADAEKRVNDTYARLRAKAAEAETQAREAADKARKASAYASMWMVVSLLIGAFVASFAATLGGRQRDL